MKEKLRQLEKSHHFWYLFGISLFFFLLRLPSLFEPYWYGDEGIYQTLGLALSRGRILYAQIWDNKPPLLYYTYALVGGDQFFVRVLSLVTGIGALILFFSLSQRIFKAQKKPTFIATSCFALFFGLPIIEGNIANAENFMLLPIIAAALIIYRIAQYPLNNQPTNYTLRTTHSLFIAGFLLGIAFLYKIVGIFDFAALFVFLIISSYPSQLTRKTFMTFISKFLKPGIFYTVGFLLPFVLSLIFFFSQGVLIDYIQAIFLSTVGYVGYNNTFIIPQGLLITKLILLAGFVLFFFLKRQQISKQTLFISLWVAFSIFNSFFSQRPYTHYILVVLPSFALLVGSIFTYRNLHRNINAIASIIIFLIAITFFNHWSLQKTFGYYTNYLQFLTNTKSVSAYQSFFDRRVPKDMELVHYINSHGGKNKTILVWGNSAQIYYQTGTLPPGRFTVAYHVAGIKKYEEETASALLKNPAEFTIIFHNAPHPSFPFTRSRQVLTTEEATIYERIN